MFLFVLLNIQFRNHDVNVSEDVAKNYCLIVFYSQPSGAAAMLMARHKELIEKPDMIKKILCSTATDLGRDRYFQGCGLVDILRALQSV
jgi:hypothetical protein